MSGLTNRSALALFIIIVVVVLAQAVWWVVFMARLVDEKVDIAEQLGASTEMVEQIHSQEIRRQIMVGMEGVFFLVLVLAGAWIIYRALIQAQDLKFHQQNFIMAVTHELKTPLASMLISLDSLQSEKIEVEKKKALVPRLKDDVRRLERIINNVLQAGRFERNPNALDLAPMNLTDSVTRVVTTVSGMHIPVPVSITTDLAENVTVLAEQSALERAIEAVLENSLKYHDGRAVEVTIALTAGPQKAILRITDRGIGLTRKECERVFDRFYRVGHEMTRRSQGTGLGLYLAREIIRAHKGEIRVQSGGPGTGATFTIVLSRERES